MDGWKILTCPSPTDLAIWRALLQKAQEYEVARDKARAQTIASEVSKLFKKK